MPTCSRPRSPTAPAAAPRPPGARVRISRAARSAPVRRRSRGARRAGRRRLAAGDAQRSLAQPADAARPRPRSAGAAHRPSAHDFAQLLGTSEVILTRAAKLGGAPTVASRFTQRLAAVAGEARWNDALARGEKYLHGRARSITAERNHHAANVRARSRRSTRAGWPQRHARSSTCCAIPTRSMRAISCGCSRSMRSIRRPARATAAR